MQIHRHGRPVVGFGLGGMPRAAWVEARDRLQDMDILITSGRGGAIVEGDRTALEMAALLRRQMGAGLGDPDVSSPPASHPPAEPSPWKYAIITTLVGAVTGWALDEIARRTFRMRR